MILRYWNCSHFLNIPSNFNNFSTKAKLLLMSCIYIYCSVTRTASNKNSRWAIDLVWNLQTRTWTFTMNWRAHEPCSQYGVRLIFLSVRCCSESLGFTGVPRRHPIWQRIVEGIGDVLCVFLWDRRFVEMRFWQLCAQDPASSFTTHWWVL